MKAHSEDTVKGQHTNLSATTAPSRRRFRSASYLEGLMAELDRAAISTRMGQSREQAGFTQPEMAELFSVHFRTVQDWESPRKKAVPFDRLGEWAELTQVKREWLLHGDEASSEDELAVRLERQLRSLDERLARMEQLLRDSPPQGHRRGRQR